MRAIAGLYNGRFFVAHRVLKRACMDSAFCSPRRPNPTCHCFAQGIIWCILGVMEESGKEALKFPMNCCIAASVGKLIILLCEL